MSATLGRIWAVASLTLKEAVRRKAFYVLVVFGIALVSSVTFFSSVDPVSRLRLIQVWSLRATVFFAALAAVFLGAFSLPSDFETRRIHVIASKPISKVSYFLGKLFGFSLMIAVFLLVMGLISVGFMRIVKASGSSQIPDLRARPRVEAAEFGGVGASDEPVPERRRVAGAPSGALVWAFRDVDPAKLGENIRLEGTAEFRSDVVARTTGTVKVEIRGADTPFVRTVPVPFRLALPARLVEAREIQVRISPGTSDLILLVDTASVKVLGDRGEAERIGPEADGYYYPERNRIVLPGCAVGALRWTLQALDPGDFPETVSGRVRLAISGQRDPFRFTANARIIVESGGQRLETESFAQSGEWTQFQFPRSFLAPDRPVHVYVFATDSDAVILSTRQWLILFETNELFEWNYLKGLGLIYLWILIILSVTVAASTFLSAPMSILLGVVILVVGSIHDFVNQGVKDIDRSMDQYRHAHERGQTARTPEDLPPWLLDSSKVGAKITLFIFPNASSFDFSKYLLSDLAVSPKEMGESALSMLPRFGIALLLGILIMAFKDFGT